MLIQVGKTYKNKFGESIEIVENLNIPFFGGSYHGIRRNTRNGEAVEWHYMFAIDGTIITYAFDSILCLKEEELETC